MWSLYKRKESEESLGEGIFNYTGEKLDPLKFSNGKSQADVVKEVLDLINAGNKVIFIRGVCGTGKSAIALNLSRHFKKTSIVVPIKSLQEQYEKDYMQNKFILKQDGKKLDIAIIKGRNNFSCPFYGEGCDCNELPCTIELRDKNKEKINEFVELNERVDIENFENVSDVRRMTIAPSCPYWSPLLPVDVNTKALDDAKKKKYMTVSGKEYALFQRKKGCGYYDQYDSYINSDVFIFNSQKYLIETAIGRKPKTDLDIIDECDEFLDNFANERKINLNRLYMALSNLFPDTAEKKDEVKSMLYLVNEISLNPAEDIEKVKNTRMMQLIEKILENPHLAENEDDNYYNNVLEIAKAFEKLLEETYVSYEFNSSGQESLFGSKKTDVVYASLVSINLAQRFKEIVESNDVLVLMSGTLHSEQVLRDIFGLRDFKIVDAETQNPGTITKYRTGLEKDCKYSNFASGQVTRGDYLKALEACVKNAKKPALVHVNAFSDLPSEYEKEQFGVNSVISKEELLDLQRRDKSNSLVENFRRGHTDVLFTTKCSRGVDFAGEKCNSIILTKYPYPNIKGLFWKILKKEQPHKFMEFYMDKARRELIQKIARGVRFKGDHVLLLSPDARVFRARLN